MGWMKKNVLSWRDLFLDGPFLFFPSVTVIFSKHCLNLLVFCTSLRSSPPLPSKFSPINSPFFATSPSRPRSLSLPFAHKHTLLPLCLCSLSLLPQLLDLSFFQSLSQISSVHLWIVSLHSCAPVQPDSSLHPSLSLSCLSPLPSSISPAPLFISSELSLHSSLLRVMATKFLLDPVWWNTHVAMKCVNTYIYDFEKDMYFFIYYVSFSPPSIVTIYYRPLQLYSILRHTNIRPICDGWTSHCNKAATSVAVKPTPNPKC